MADRIRMPGKAAGGYLYRLPRDGGSQAARNGWLGQIYLFRAAILGFRSIEPPSLAVDLIRAAGPYKTGYKTVSLPASTRYQRDFAELAAASRTRRALAVSLRDDLLVPETLMRASEM